MNTFKILVGVCLYAGVAMNVSCAGRSAATRQSAAETGAATQTAVAGGVMRVRLTAVDGKGLGRGMVRVESFPGRWDFPVDRDGVALVRLPAGGSHEYSVVLTALAPGYGAEWVEWDLPAKTLAGEPPAEMTMALVPEAAVSGVMRNEAGDGIAGAKLQLFLSGLARAGM